MWKVLLFVLPLGLDSFAVAAAWGTQRLSGRQRWRLCAVFVAFEAGMPLVGLALGAPAARLVGTGGVYGAAALLVAVGLWMIFSGDDDEQAGRLLTARWATLVLVGLSISLDELAIGFTLGLAGLAVTPVVVAIGVQALVASQLGLALGARIGERWRERVERLAGVLLVLLGAGLAVDSAGLEWFP